MDRPVTYITDWLASVYAARYISDRFLPDKAIDLVDEAASSLRLAQESKPDEPEVLDREVATLQIELESLKNETDVFSVDRRHEVEKQLEAKRDEAARLGEVWQAGKCLRVGVIILKVWRTDMKYILQNVHGFMVLRKRNVSLKKPDMS